MTEKRPCVFIAAEGRLAGRLERLIRDRYDVDILEKPAGVNLFCKRTREIGADAVVIDCDLPGFDWVSAAFEINDLEPRPAILALSQNPDKAALLSAFREGADAFVPKRHFRDDIVTALKAVMSGHVFFRREQVDEIRDHLRYLELGSARNVAGLQDGIRKLTVRQKEVFPLLADGKRIKEIGKILGISPKTVETHKYNIMEKLGLKRMADLTKLALIKDLLPL